MTILPLGPDRIGNLANAGHLPTLAYRLGAGVGLRDACR